MQGSSRSPPPPLSAPPTVLFKVNILSKPRLYNQITRLSNIAQAPYYHCRTTRTPQQHRYTHSTTKSTQKPNKPKLTHTHTHKMPAPSQLAIATQAVTRLVKEDKYYEKEVTTQEGEIKKLEADLPEATKTDENAEFMLRQVVSLSESLYFPIKLPFFPSLQSARACKHEADTR